VPAIANERRVDYIWIREARRLLVEPTDFQPAGFLLDRNSQTRLSDHPPIIAQLFDPTTDARNLR